jgi:ABC-type branched-subunit amino acid transport system substrate-binding protein
LEDDANGTTLVNNYQRLLNDSSVQFLLGPVHSDFSLMVKPLTDPIRRLVMSPSAASTLWFNTTYGENFALSIVTSASRFLLPSLPYLRLAGAKSLYFINEDLGIHRQFCGAITPSLALDQGLSVKGRFQVPSVDVPELSPADKVVFEDAVNRALNSSADAIVGCMYGAAAQALLQIFYDRQVAPKAFIFVTFTASEWNELPPHLSNFVAGVEQYDSITNWPSDVFVGPSTNFTAIYTQRYGEAPDEYAAFGALSGYALQWAVENSPDPFNQAAVRDTLMRINVPTFMGLYSYGVDGANYLPTIFYQYVNNKRVVVGPPSVSSGVEFVYPFPSWYERTPHVYFGKNAAESVVTAILIVFIIGSIVCAIGVVKYWSHDVIRAASPPFLLAFLLGSVILYLSILTWPITSISMAICHLRIWALGVGFVLVFAPLIIKSYRIHRLWANESVEIVKITNVQLGAILAAVLLVEIVRLNVSSIVYYVSDTPTTDPDYSGHDCFGLHIGARRR